MAGLLDVLNSPIGQGLLSAAFTGMATANRGSPLNSIGRAGLGGLVGYSNAADRQVQMAGVKRREDAINALRGKMDPNMAPLLDIAPEYAVKAMFKEPEKPQLVTVAGPDGRPMQKWMRPGESTGVDIGIAPDKESALPWYVRKGPDGKTMIDPAYADFEKSKASAGRPPTPFFQFLPTPNGYAVGDARSGRIAPASIDGKPVIRSQDDPALQGRIAGAKETGKTLGEGAAKAALDAPRIIENAETAIRLSDELLKHPGFEQAVGASSMLGIQKVPGTDARDFVNRLDQVKGGAFLEAFNTLRGGGQITEVEGKKATDAIARMDNATSEKEFRAAVRDYQDVIRKGVGRAKMRARPVGPMAPVEQPAPASGAKFLGFE